MDVADRGDEGQFGAVEAGKIEFGALDGGGGDEVTGISVTDADEFARRAGVD